MNPPAPRDGSSRHDFLTALSFSNIHESVRAAHELKRRGFDIQVAPRREPGCGVIVLVDRGQRAAAAAVLAAARVVPLRVGDYEPRGGADADGSRRTAACS